MKILVFILSGMVAAAIIGAIRCKIIELRTFRRGHNPFARICKKCGSHQHQYRSNIEGEDLLTWWEEVYPIGNDENCICHKFAQHR